TTSCPRSAGLISCSPGRSWRDSGWCSDVQDLTFDNFPWGPSRAKMTAEVHPMLRSAWILCSLPLFLACHRPLRAQAMVDAALGAGAAASSAGGMQSASKGIAGALGNLDRALNPDKKQAGSSSTTIVVRNAPAPTAPPAPAVE